MTATATTVTLPFTGHDAIEAALAASGLTICKYQDPTEGAREGLRAAEARSIAAEDPDLIYVTAGLDWFGTSEETVARVGAISILVQSPDARPGQVAVLFGDLDGDWQPVKPDAEMIASAEAALARYLEGVLDR